MLTLLLSTVCVVSLIAPHDFGHDINATADFVRDFVFFNSSHVFLTLVTLGALPESRSYLRKSWDERRIWIFVGLGLILILPVTRFIADANYLGRWGVFFLLLVPNILFFLHAVAQTCGLCLLYNRRAALLMSETERNELKRTEAIERYGYRTVIGLTVLGYLLARLPNPVPHWIFNLTSAFGIATVAVLVVWTHFVYSEKMWRNKRRYVFRLFVYPLLPFLGIGGAALGIWHGTEYLFLTTGLVQRSTSRRRALIAYLLPVICIVVMLPQIIYKQPELAHFFWGNWQTWPYSVRESFILFTFTIDYLHYFLDGNLFRLKSPSVRSFIAPLLGV